VRFSHPVFVYGVEKFSAPSQAASMTLNHASTDKTGVCSISWTFLNSRVSQIMKLFGGPAESAATKNGSIERQNSWKSPLYEAGSFYCSMKVTCFPCFVKLQPACRGIIPESAPHREGSTTS